MRFICCTFVKGPAGRFAAEAALESIVTSYQTSGGLPDRLHELLRLPPAAAGSTSNRWSPTGEHFREAASTL
jgi:hypothetical protein